MIMLFGSRSGGMDTRPILAYMAARVGAMLLRISSVKSFMVRIRWLAGTICSGESIRGKSKIEAIAPDYLFGFG